MRYTFWCGIILAAISLFSCIEGCQHSLGANTTVAPARRRRQTSSSNDGQVIETTNLRQFFTACLSVRIPESTYDWRTNVDFSVLDTVWYINNADLHCGFGSPRAPCWKENLVTYLNIQSSLVEPVRTCIDEFAEDYAYDPPRNRYQQVVVQSRRKRGFFEEANRRTEYSFCLSEGTEFTGTSVDLREPLNFERLTDFVEEETTTDACFSTFEDTSRTTDFPNRFVLLTRTDSPLRIPLEDCGREFFPEDFPPSPVRPVFDDPVVWDQWNNWLDCNAQCGSGMRYRDRGCLMASQFGVRVSTEFCECMLGNVGGLPMESEFCNLLPCPSRDTWSDWNSWSECSVSCGSGRSLRTRSCSGNECPGSGEETITCTVPCPPPSPPSGFPPGFPPLPPTAFTPPPTIPFTPWTSWGPCRTTCGGPGVQSTQIRYRCRQIPNGCRNPDSERRNCPGLPLCPQFG